MKSFSEFVDGKDKDINVPELSDDMIYRICKVAWRKHRKETEQFLTQLSEKDSEIQSMLNNINGGDGPVLPDDMNKEKDEVVPSAADGSPGLENGGDEG